MINQLTGSVGGIENVILFCDIGTEDLLILTCIKPEKLSFLPILFVFDNVKSNVARTEALLRHVC